MTTVRADDQLKHQIYISSRCERKREILEYCRVVFTADLHCKWQKDEKV